MIYMFLSNNPSSGDINSSNLPCYFLATLTSDLVLIVIVSGAYLLYYLRRESKIWCMNASWDG